MNTQNRTSDFKNWLISHEDFLFMVATITAVVLTYVGIIWFDGWNDIDNYYRNISEVIDSRLMPYSETVFEYPPFTLVFFALAKFLSWDLASFHFSYSIMALIALFVECNLVLRIVCKLSMSKDYSRLILVAMIIFGNQFILCRNDIFAGVLMTAAIWLYVEKRYDLSAILLGISFMTKLYPSLILPALLIPFLVKKDLKSCFRFAVIFVAVFLLIELPFLINDPSTAFAYLSYHSDRGIQIQSVVASIFLLINIFVPGTVTGEGSYGSWNICSDLCDTIAPMMNIILAVVFIATLLFILYRFVKNRTDERGCVIISVGMVSVIGLLIAITFSKVYSAQYILWFMMLIPLCFIKQLSDKEKKTLFILTVSLAAFIMLNGLVFYNEMCDFEPLGEIITVLKNVIHVALMIYLMKLCFKTINSVHSDDLPENR